MFKAFLCLSGLVPYPITRKRWFAQLPSSSRESSVAVILSSTKHVAVALLMVAKPRWIVFNFKIRKWAQHGHPVAFFLDSKETVGITKAPEGASHNRCVCVGGRGPPNCRPKTGTSEKGT